MMMIKLIMEFLVRRFIVTPQERYNRDPLFHRLVDTLEALIVDANMTPTEIRECAMLACIHHEHKRAIPYPIPMPRKD